eukprot:391480-Prymnesium_polylepis.1
MYACSSVCRMSTAAGMLRSLMPSVTCIRVGRAPYWDGMRAVLRKDVRHLGKGRRAGAKARCAPRRVERSLRASSCPTKGRRGGTCVSRGRHVGVTWASGELPYKRQARGLGLKLGFGEEVTGVRASSLASLRKKAKTSVRPSSSPRKSSPAILGPG